SNIWSTRSAAYMRSLPVLNCARHARGTIGLMVNTRFHSRAWCAQMLRTYEIEWNQELNIWWLSSNFVQASSYSGCLKNLRHCETLPNEIASKTIQHGGRSGLSYLS